MAMPSQVKPATMCHLAIGLKESGRAAACRAAASIVVNL